MNLPFSSSSSPNSMTASMVLLSRMIVSDGLNPVFLFPSNDSTIQHRETPETCESWSRVPLFFKEIVIATVPCFMSLVVSYILIYLLIIYIDVKHFKNISFRYLLYQNTRRARLVEVIIKESEAAERSAEARAWDQEVEQEPDIPVAGVECVKVCVTGAEVVLTVIRHDFPQTPNIRIKNPNLLNRQNRSRSTLDLAIDYVKLRD